MEAFLAGDITERELFDRTQPQEIYDALYLSAAITVPGHRREGLAIKLFEQAIERIPHTKDATLFAWPTTDDGRVMAEAISKKSGIVVRLRQP